MLAGAYYAAHRRPRARRARSGRNVERALDWIERYGDADGDGFVEYARRSPTGLLQPGLEGLARLGLPRRRHARRGADRAVRGAGLRLRARRRAARAIGDGARATHEPRGRSSRRRREALRARFESAFWCEDLGTYALALDGDKRPCRVRTSNAGHCLFTRHRAARGARGASPRRCSRRRRLLRLGRPHASPRRGALQPDGVPQRLGLAARQRAHRAGLARYGHRRRPRCVLGGCSTRACTSTCAACPSCSAASRAGRARGRRSTRWPARRRRGRRRAVFLLLAGLPRARRSSAERAAGPLPPAGAAAVPRQGRDREPALGGRRRSTLAAPRARRATSASTCLGARARSRCRSSSSAPTRSETVFPKAREVRDNFVALHAPPTPPVRSPARRAGRARLAGRVPSIGAATAPIPLRPLTADEVAARDRIRKGLLGNDPEGERAAIEARLASQTFETPKQLERRTVQAGGRDREYFVFVPESAKGKPAPVVFGAPTAKAPPPVSRSTGSRTTRAPRQRKASSWCIRRACAAGTGSDGAAAAQPAGRRSR